MLTATLSDNAKSQRLTELIHRAIPYPVVLVTVQADSQSLSLAHKRWSQGEAAAIVIEEVRRTSPMPQTLPAPIDAAFLASIALSGICARDLFELYQRWIDLVIALEAASITGVFATPESAERATARREALAAHARLRHDIAAIRAQAARETQMNRRVDLNLAIKRLETELAAAAKAL